MMIQMRTLKPRNYSEDANTETSPGSPRPLTRNSSPSPFVRERLSRSRQGNQLLPSPGSTQRQQQQMRVYREAFSSSRSSSRPASRRGSVGDTVSDGPFPTAAAACLAERMVACPVDSQDLPSPPSVPNANDDKKEEDEAAAEEGGNDQQQEEEPSATADSPQPPSPLITILSDDHCPSSSSSTSALSSSPPAEATDGETKTRLSPPLYLNESTMHNMTTAKALELFLDMPVLSTPQEFIRAVSWKRGPGDGGDSRAYVVVDEDGGGQGGPKWLRRIGSWRSAGEGSEDLELKDWKYKE
ncbi:hypothetical protein PG997_011159 [Apiospora hydei]|uniref:Uncharacterized protein n=1 Tax=Apiospora hydei TaxID=1337664 RepID=A0ABR1VKX8_9PEZI